MCYNGIIKEGEQTPIGGNKMYSFEIQSKTDRDNIKFVFGYDWKDAFRRSALNPDEWNILSSEYED